MHKAKMPAGRYTYPTFGNPTIPIFKEVPKRPIRGACFGPSPPFFGGICGEKHSYPLSL